MTYLIGLVLYLVAATTIGLWSWRVYELYRKREVSWLAKVSAPLAGTVLIVAILLIMLTTLLVGIFTMFDMLWRMIKHTPEFLKVVFVSFIMMTTWHNLLGYKIDSQDKFWFNIINTLNHYRKLYPESPYIYQVGMIYIRDPHAHPMRSVWRFSTWHPFMLLKNGGRHEVTDND